MIRTQRCTLVVILALTAIPANAADPITWRTDYPNARKEAEEKKLPLLVVISTNDCFYCKKMDAATFLDANILPFINAKFIPLKIDATTNPEFAKAMRVTVYPTTIIAGHDGKVHGFFAGYLDANQFKDNASRALASIVAVPEVKVAQRPKPQPAPARELLTLAKDAFHSERYSECMAYCDTILSAHADLPEAKEATQLLTRIKQDVEKLASAGQQLDERNSRIYMQLAETWATKGQYRESHAAYEKAVRLAPDNAVAKTFRDRWSELMKQFPQLQASSGQ